MYSVQSDVVFDPFQLDCEVTPEKIQEASQNREHAKALILSVRMNEVEYICQVMEAVKPADSKSTCSLLCRLNATRTGGSPFQCSLCAPPPLAPPVPGGGGNLFQTVDVD